MKEKIVFLGLGILLLSCFLAACAQKNDSEGHPSTLSSEATTQMEQPIIESSMSFEAEKSVEETPPPQAQLVSEQVLEGETGTIHYSYYLPEGYGENRRYPLVVTMPGYDMMWFGEDSSGANLDWGGFLCWTTLPEDMIVVSAQLTDWQETSARQAIELTEYFIHHFPVDQNRVYAVGYSAGGETMSQAVSIRPDLYAAYLHGASQWDGEFTPIAEHGVAVYIFMAENDEYYGSQRAWDAYNGLYAAYESAGWAEEEIDTVLQIQTPDNLWFAQRGITENYHGGGNAVFDEPSILDWIVRHCKKGEPTR